LKLRFERSGCQLDSTELAATEKKLVSTVWKQQQPKLIWLARERDW
jgi:hypothetical protein